LGKKLEIILSNNTGQIVNIVSSLKKNKFEFEEFNIQKRSLESIFVDYIKRYKNDKL